MLKVGGFFLKRPCVHIELVFFAMPVYSNGSTDEFFRKLI
jgi:hypothetical protein